MAEKKWYVIYSKPRWEKKVDAALIRKGIESWCPLNKVQKQWSDRKKVVEEPLFKSYIFVRVEETEKLEVLMTPGVLNFIYYLKQPATIRDEDIETIKRYLMLEEVKIEVVSSVGFKENTKVKVSHGVFIDSEGTVLRGNQKKVYVQIQSLGQLMVVEFKAEHLISV
jgi:transcription antitermination factor NusG